VITAPDDIPGELDDELAELIGASNSMLTVTPVAGQDKTVSSAVASMSATAAGEAERTQVEGWAGSRTGRN